MDADNMGIYCLLKFVRKVWTVCFSDEPVYEYTYEYKRWSKYLTNVQIQLSKNNLFIFFFCHFYDDSVNYLERKIIWTKL